MSFGQSISHVFSNLTNFSGRASRSEFWWFYLFTLLVSGIPTLLGAIFFLGGVSSDPGAMESSGSIGVMGVIGVLFYIVGILASLAFIIPTLAVGCRRLHDRGTSGWLQLLLLVPCANFIVLIFWLLAGTEGDNIYGPKPTNA